MLSFLEQLDHICRRPEMYVGERRFQTVAAWLNGYSSGLQECKRPSDGPVGLEGFRDWLSETLYKSHGMFRNLVWQAYVKDLSSDDEDALQRLPQLYQEFLNQKISEYVASE